MQFPQIIDTFVRANSATVGNGWVLHADPNIFTIAANRLKAVTSPNTNQLVRPAIEDVASQRVDVELPVMTSGLFLLLRSQAASSAGANKRAYGVIVGDNNLLIYRFDVGGTFEASLSSSVFAFPAGAKLGVRGTITGTTSTTITADVFNLTLDPSMTGTPIITRSVIDTLGHVSLQGSGGIGLAAGSLYELTRLASYAPTVTQAAATALTLTAADGALTTVGLPVKYVVEMNGSNAGVIVTPSAGAGGGTFSPATLTLTSAATRGTFVYTPDSAGAKSISITNNAALGNPAAVALTVEAATVTIPVDSTAMVFSPATWIGDGAGVPGRTGAAWRQSWNVGGWFRVKWTTTATSPTMTIVAPLPNVALKYVVAKTGGATTTGRSTLPGGAAIGYNLSSLLSGPGTYEATVYLSSSALTSRFGVSSDPTLNAVDVIRVTGVRIDSTGTFAQAATGYTNWVLFVGDSITEGADMTGAEVAYPALIAADLKQNGYDYTVSACGGTSFGVSAAGVPVYYGVSGSTNGIDGTYNAASRWDKIAGSVSLLVAGRISGAGAAGQEPSIIFINYGTNEWTVGGLTNRTTAGVNYDQNVRNLKASVHQSLVALRAAAPTAAIIVQVPFHHEPYAGFPGEFIYSGHAIMGGVASYQAAFPADTKVTLSNLGTAYALTLSALHPNDAEHVEIFDRLRPTFRAALGLASGRILAFISRFGGRDARRRAGR